MEEIYTISNEFLSASVHVCGAELMHLSTKTGNNILWKRDPEFWNRTAPHLFPVVGRLFNDQYHHNGTLYHMPQHGFARDHEFRLLELNENSAVFSLRSNAELEKKYPFSFELQVRFHLIRHSLKISYTSINTGIDNLYYSVGGHPAFALHDPIDAYELSIDRPQLLHRQLLNGSFLSGEQTSVDFNHALPLSYNLFEKDAMVFLDPAFQTITLRHRVKGPLVSLSSDSWSALGVWTKKNAPFICLEPWWGWADSNDLKRPGELKNKAGIRMLQPGNRETTEYQIQLHE